MRLDIAHLYMYARSKSLLLLDVCDALFGEDQILCYWGCIKDKWEVIFHYKIHFI